MQIKKVSVLFFTILVLMGCGSIQPAQESINSIRSETILTPTVSSTPFTDTTSTEQINTGDDSIVETSTHGLETLIEKAKADLTQRLSISLREITLVEASEVVWPDASLGCPQPNMLYKQVPSDGARIILEVEGISYEYHSGGADSELFLCEKSPAKTEKPQQIDITKLTPQSPAAKNPTPPLPDNSIPPGEDQ